MTSTLVQIDIESHDVTGPGQPRLDSGSPQQAAFPCQMLSQGFWAATHLLLAVRLRCPLSSIGSSRRLIEIMQIAVMEHECVMSIQNTVFSGQTGHHEHRRQEVTDAINAHHEVPHGHHSLQAHCQCHGDRRVSLPCHSCLDVSPHSTNSGYASTKFSWLPSSDNNSVVCWFRLCFTIFHARRLQIMARMTEGSLPRSSAMFVNKLPWRLQESLSLLCLRDIWSTLPPVPAHRYCQRV